MDKNLHEILADKIIEEFEKNGIEPKVEDIPIIINCCKEISKKNE